METIFLLGKVRAVLAAASSGVAKVALVIGHLVL
jgi:hypothetical protein